MAQGIRLRESPRARLAEAIRLRLRNDSHFEAQAADLSTTGVGVISSRSAPLSEEVEFELSLGGEVARGRAEVIWWRDPRPDRSEASTMGLRFTALDPDSKALIESHLRSLGDATETRVQPTDRTPVLKAEPAEARPPAAPETAPPAVVAQRSVEREAESQPERLEGSYTEEVEERLVPDPSPAFARVLIGGVAALVVAAIAIWAFSEGRRQPTASAEGRDDPSQERSTTLTTSPPIPTVEPLPTAVSLPPPAPVGLSVGSARVVEEVPGRSGPTPIARDATQAPEDGASPTGLNRVVSIDASLVDGQTLVAVRAQAALTSKDIFATMLGPLPARYLVRVSGVGERYQPDTVEVGMPMVERIRTGFHHTNRGPELHLVLDLPSKETEVTWAVREGQLELRLSRAPN